MLNPDGGKWLAYVHPYTRTRVSCEVSFHQRIDLKWFNKFGSGCTDRCFSRMIQAMRIHLIEVHVSWFHIIRNECRYRVVIDGIYVWIWSIRITTPIRCCAEKQVKWTENCCLQSMIRISIHSWFLFASSTGQCSSRKNQTVRAHECYIDGLICVLSRHCNGEQTITVAQDRQRMHEIQVWKMYLQNDVLGLGCCSSLGKVHKFTFVFFFILCRSLEN